MTYQWCALVLTNADKSDLVSDIVENHGRGRGIQFCDILHLLFVILVCDVIIGC